MTSGDSSKFSAAQAALGYLYQVRSALLWSLRRMKRGADFQVSVETVDDVTFDLSGEVTDLLQTKHHLAGVASLTDASPDMWKTLRIWFEGREREEIPATANLFIITTSSAPAGSAAAHLRADPRDVVAAQQRLDAAASSSTSHVNAKAYEVYRNAAPDHRTAVLSQIVVIDAAPSIIDLDNELLMEVFWAVDKDHHPAFLARLEGWWMRRVIRQLAGEGSNRIASVELDLYMADLREQFKREALPIDEDLLEVLDEATISQYSDYRFVRQLEIIKLGSRLVSFAIQDYYKAFTQRSRWLREDLVVDLDLRKYEARLVEEWSRVFERMREEIGDDVTDEMKERAAKAVLEWADKTIIPIRPAVTEPFVSRGSFHMLADDLKVGWHPEFRERLAALLQTARLQQ